MTSSSGQTVDDGKSSETYNFGFILATHDEESCINEDHPDLPIPITTRANAYIVELGACGDNGKFATPSSATIKYDNNEHLISHWSIPRDKLFDDSWCSSFT